MTLSFGTTIRFNYTRKIHSTTPWRKFNTLQMSINWLFNKTKCLFTTNRHFVRYQPKNFLKGQLLESTKTPTYLVSDTSNCSKYINRLCEKGRKGEQLLKIHFWKGLGSRYRHTQDHLYCTHKANP
ncbi:hypothetical protein CEXT_720031 [Caerostris extrusa]|uniref:Uncharacterized protein n=1 Tax=Caerostris extrusa TaxID=172846 RepID=A0AAV4T8W5_CAEEX|nr:hypothetical protein CEXT_720031 [Caerostris extrusa]